MLFVVVLKAHQGTLEERAQRRIRWEYPDGVKPIAEYWLSTDDPSVISIVELDDVNLITLMRMDWDDLMDIEVFPAVTSEQGIEAIKQMASS